MIISDPKYPKPSRPSKKDGLKGTEFYKEIDTGRTEVVLDDGRPSLIEYWYDVETGLDCVTAFYSTLGIEYWTAELHREYLTRNHIIKAATRGCSTMIFIDSADKPMWSVNWVEE